MDQVIVYIAYCSQTGSIIEQVVTTKGSDYHDVISTSLNTGYRINFFKQSVIYEASHYPTTQNVSVIKVGYLNNRYRVSNLMNILERELFIEKRKRLATMCIQRYGRLWSFNPLYSFARRNILKEYEKD